MAGVDKVPATRLWRFLAETYSNPNSLAKTVYGEKTYSVQPPSR